MVQQQRIDLFSYGELCLEDCDTRPRGTDLAKRLEQATANFRSKTNWPQWYGQPLNRWLLIPLRQQAHDHCSFCDGSPLPGGMSQATIEHFHPKSEDSPQRFDWMNLFLCCQACQGAKGIKWDDRLLRPDKDDYSFERYFECDFTRGAIRPNSQADPADQDRARITIAIYDLCRHDGSRAQLSIDWRLGIKNDPDIDNRAFRYWLRALKSADSEENAKLTPSQILFGAT